MSDVQAWCNLIILFVVLGLTAWAFFAEMRIQAMAGKLLLDKQREADDAIAAKVHSLSDADLAAAKQNFFSGRFKP